LRTAETIHHEVEEIYDFVTRRACEIFLRRRDASTLSIEDWLTAEKEVLWKPEVRVVEKERQVIVEVPLGTKAPQEIEILVTPAELLLQTVGKRGPKRVFRTIQFPRRIDVQKVTARYSSGIIVLIAATIRESGTL
jgi:HSP20 family molecular chaperone IbpA